MAMSEEEVLKKVQSVLVDALGVDEDEVTPTSTLVGDLGAESIDFLDIVFRLEKAFGIKVNQGELFPELLQGQDAKYVVEGKLTDAGMAELRARIPYVNLDEFDKSRQVAEFANVFTVSDLAKFVATKLPA